MADGTSPKVLIVNFAGHNFSDARRWGELTTITDGYVRLDKPDRALKDIVEKVADSTEADWLLPSGLLLLNILAAVAYYEKHGQIRLLVHDKKRERQQQAGSDIPIYREVVIDKSQIELLFEHRENTRDVA